MSNVGGVSLPTGPCGTMHAGCTGAALQRQLGASGLALAARTTVALLNLKVQSFEEPPQAKFVSLRTIMAGAMLLVGHSHVVQRASRIAQRGSGRLPQQTHRTVEWRKWPVSTTVSQLRLEVPSASYLLFSAASRAHHDPKGAMADNSLGHHFLAIQIDHWLRQCDG